MLLWFWFERLFSRYFFVSSRERIRLLPDDRDYPRNNRRLLWRFALCRLNQLIYFHCFRLRKIARPITVVMSAARVQKIFYCWNWLRKHFFKATLFQILSLRRCQFGFSAKIQRTLMLSSSDAVILMLPDQIVFLLFNNSKPYS